MTIALTVLVPFCLPVSSLPDLPNHYRNPTRPTVYKGWSEEQPNDELPSAYGSDQEEATLLLVILPPHAHASRRCETQAAQSAKLRLAFRSVDPFRALWEPDRRRRGRRTAFPCSEQRTGNKPKQSHDRESPYNFEWIFPIGDS